MSIFWEQIRKARDFVEKLCCDVVEGKSVLLSFPEGTPWSNELYSFAENLFLERSPDYTVYLIENEDSSLDTLLLERFCRREVRATYRRNMGVAAFLASRTDTPLHSSYVWVRIRSEQRLNEWMDFVGKYLSLMSPKPEKASFILETEGLHTVAHTKGIGVLDWSQSADAYDVYTYCALESSETNIAPLLRPYLVELASRLCGTDVELARVCVLAGEDFLSAPEETLRELKAFAARSNGQPFSFPIDSEKCAAHIWEAQIRCLFAILEKYRSSYVSRHKPEIMACLPFSTKDRILISELKDVELGHLVYLAAEKRLHIPSTDYDMLDFLRQARNDLAHLNMLSFEKVQRILRLGSTL